MNFRSSFSSWLRRSGWAILLIALLQFILHQWANIHDNFFRDELYYLAAGQHLAPGYVEYPPFVAFATAFSRAVFGTSVAAIRLLPSLAAALIVVLTADMVARLGGGLLAQILAAFAVALAPVFLGSSGLMSMDPFDQLWWTLAAWVLLRLITDQKPHLWLVFGVVAGLGLLTKLTIGFYILALLIGLLLTGQRRLLFNRWLIIGGVIALVMMSPYLAWQAAHGLPGFGIHPAVFQRQDLSGHATGIFRPAVCNPQSPGPALMARRPLLPVLHERRQTLSCLRLGLSFPVHLLHAPESQVLLAFARLSDLIR